MIMLGIVMVIAQTILGDVPAWMLLTNWVLSGGASYVLWDCVERYRLGRSVYRGSVIVPWTIMVSMANLCCAIFSSRMWAAENYLAVICFLLLMRISMALWQKEDAVNLLVWQGLIQGLASALFPGMLLWLLIVPAELFFMRCSSIKNYLVIISGMLLGVWTSICITYFFAPEGSLADMGARYQEILVIDWHLHLSSLWQWLTVCVGLGLTLLYCMITLLLNVSNTLRAQSINHLLCVCQIMVLLFTLLDMDHLPVYLLLQTMLLGLQLIVILANSRGYLSEWWTLLLVLCYMALSMGPYLPQHWFQGWIDFI